MKDAKTKKNYLRQAAAAVALQIAAVDGILPAVQVVAAGSVDRCRGVLEAAFSVCILALNYVLIIRPVVKNCRLLTSPVDTKEAYQKMSRLKKGTGLERIFYYIYRRQREMAENEYSSEILRQEAELMALQSQMNPHFLYNTLECIRGYALMHDVPEIANMTEALAKVSRKMTASNSKLVTLQEEIRLAENYMTIQRFRFHNRFELVSRVEDQEVLKLQVLNLMLQPIVENAVVHGFHGRQGEYRVLIDAYITEKRLVIKVEDDGVGMPPDKLARVNEKINEGSIIDQVKNAKPHIGIALPNVNKRIKMNFGEAYGLNIMSTQGVGTTVEIVLPLTV